MTLTHKIRRINLHAGPGIGKSRLAAWLYSQLKDLNYSVELVREEIKLAAYQGKHPEGFDILDYFTKQLRQEEQWLRSGVDLIVTDCPISLNVAYARIHDAPLAHAMDEVRRLFDKKYVGMNIILERDHTRYITQGRYQTYDQAKDLDVNIRAEIVRMYHYQPLFYVLASDRQCLLDTVIGKLGNDNET